MTHTTSYLEPFLAYVERYAPGFRKTCVRAPLSDIQELELLAGHPLPPAYREFLGRMGLDLGDLDLLRADYNIDSLISRYYVHEPEHPRHFILVALDIGEMGIDYYIDFSNTAALDGPLVAFDWQAQADPLPVFHSFLGHVVAGGVRRHAMARFAAQHTVKLPLGSVGEHPTSHLGSSLPIPPVRQTAEWATMLLRQLGFSPALDGGRGCLVLERHDTCALLLQFPAIDSLHIELGGEDARLLRHLEEVLHDNW